VVATGVRTPTERARRLSTLSPAAPLAQLAEHRTFNPLVVGSSPTGGTSTSILDLTTPAASDVFIRWSWDPVPQGHLDLDPRPHHASSIGRFHPLIVGPGPTAGTSTSILDLTTPAASDVFIR
jgi:hypothetical protein